MISDRRELTRNVCCAMRASASRVRARQYCTSRRVEHGVEVSRFRAIIVLSLEFCVSLGVVSGESAAVCFRNKLFLHQADIRHFSFFCTSSAR